MKNVNRAIVAIELISFYKSVHAVAKGFKNTN